MRILWIRAKNFKCYSDIRVPAQDIFPKGLLFVEGENSTGKSSLFDAIFYAFFYDPTTTKELGTKDDLIRNGYSETEVDVAFELDEKCFLIQRSHSKKAAVQAFLLEIEKESALEGKIANTRKISEGVVDVEAKIISLLNITKEKALNTIIVRQGSVQTLAEAKGAELRNIIYELFQLDYYRDSAIEIIKNKKSVLEEKKEKYTIERTTENIQTEIEETKESIENSKEDVKTLDDSIDRIQIKIKQFPKINEIQDINGLTQRLDQQRITIERKERTISETGTRFGLKIPISIKEIEAKSKEFDKQLAENSKNKQEIQNTIEIYRNERSNHELELENFSNRKISLERIAETGEKPRCDVCEQEINEEKFQELLGRSKRNIPLLENGIKKKEVAINKERKAIQEIESENNKLRQSIGKLEELINDIEELEILRNSKEDFENNIQVSLEAFKVNNLDELSKKFGLKDFKELFSHVKSLDDEMKSTELKKKHSLDLIRAKHENIGKLEKDIEENKNKEEKRAELDLDIALLNEVQTYVEKFIVEDLISKRMLANIQQSTKGYIYLFTRGRYSELYLQPTKTKTLNMSIMDEELGFVKSQTLLSGGDKAAIGLGLRIGVSELLKRIRPMKTSPYEPPKMDILVLDEPLGSLDEARRSKVIEGLVAEEKFSQIFLITHTNIRRRFSAPLISIQSSSKGSKVSFYPSTSELEEEAEA
ncbi:MAG: AAA family ATPase [Candidatus Heimdallarchaeota archaeon]|nr:AAA family ATPase [Candidatus Heimdallarchaeota archaeon]MCK4955906.1 AAA family ATPase [Candidatus Heimdallarchaeota archaeon]